MNLLLLSIVNVNVHIYDERFITEMFCYIITVLFISPRGLNGVLKWMVGVCERQFRLDCIDMRINNMVYYILNFRSQLKYFACLIYCM